MQFHFSELCTVTSLLWHMSIHPSEKELCDLSYQTPILSFQQPLIHFFLVALYKQIYVRGLFCVWSSFSTPVGLIYAARYMDALLKWNTMW